MGFWFTVQQDSLELNRWMHFERLNSRVHLLRVPILHGWQRVAASEQIYGLNLLRILETPVAMLILY